MNDTGGAVPGSIHSLIPDPEVVLALEPEELAGFLMGSLNSLPASEQRGLNRFNFGLEHTVREYPEDRCLSTRMRRWSRVISEHSRGWQAC